MRKFAQLLAIFYLGAISDQVISGDLTVTGEVSGMSSFTPTVVASATPTEPHACDAAHLGAIVAIDDTDDGSWSSMCTCAYDDNPGTYDWRDLGDIFSAACSAF